MMAPAPRLLSLLLLAGCEHLGLAVAAAGRQGTPVVRAQDGAFASLTIIACPSSETRALAVGELIQILTQHDELVSAREGGTARLVINACPFPAVVAAAVRRRAE